MLRIFIRVFLVSIVYLQSCNLNSVRQVKSSESIRDSLVTLANDSLYKNASFSKSILKQALSYPCDSLKYFEIYSKLTKTYIIINEYDSGYRMSKRLLKFCSNKPLSSRIHTLLADANNNLGIYYGQISRLDSSIYYYRIASNHVRLGENRKQVVDVLINLADMYTRKGDLVNGIFIFRKALLASDSLCIAQEMGFPIYFGLGQAYLGLNDFSQSDQYFRLAEPFLESRNLSEKFTYCNNRGNYYYYNEKYEAALPWFKKAKALVIPENYKFYINLCDLNLSDIYCKLNKLDSAQYFIDRSFRYFNERKNKTALFYIATINAEIALKRNNPSLAMKWYERYSDCKDIEPQIQSIRNKSLQKYYEYTGNYKLAYSIIQKNQKLDDSLRSERIKSRVAEIDYRYKNDTSLLKRDLQIQKQKSKISYLRLSKFFWLLVFFTTVIIISFAYIYMRKQRDLLRMKHFDEVAKLRMQNIHNRISPHFAFNILNREIISSSNGSSALPDLVKLLRRSLEMSEKLCVSLAQELEFIKTYIEIEKKGSPEKFSLDIEIDKVIDCSHVFIPAMIIQIPVENAVKHALRKIEGEKKLLISISKEGNCVKIVIQDNGMGYNPISQSREGTGTGLKVVYQTIQLLNSKNRDKIRCTIDNLCQQGIRGTRVEICIPDSYSYEL